MRSLFSRLSRKKQTPELEVLFSEADIFHEPFKTKSGEAFLKNFTIPVRSEADILENTTDIRTIFYVFRDGSNAPTPRCFIEAQVETDDRIKTTYAVFPLANGQLLKCPMQAGDKILDHRGTELFEMGGFRKGQDLPPKPIIICNPPKIKPTNPPITASEAQLLP